MFFYITESIALGQFHKGKKIKASHIKVGIASDVEERFKEYNTIAPDISAVRSILVNKDFAKKLEKMFKYYLWQFRIGNSECYNITPKEAIFFLSKCFITKGKVIVDWLSKDQKYLFYLDSIYFDKKIPLFIIKRIRKFKDKPFNKNFDIEIINKWSSEETKKFLQETHINFHYLEVIEDKYNFTNNIFYHLIKKRLNSIQNQVDFWNNYDGNITHVEMIDFFSDQMFWVLREYYEIFKRKKRKKKKFIDDFNFFNKKIKSGKKLMPDENIAYIVGSIKRKNFYSLSWMLDKRGSPSKKKNDPYQFTTPSTTYWTSFEASIQKTKSLLGPTKKTRVG